MDTITPELWRAADAALLAEVRAEADHKPARDVMAAAMARLRAWAALERHRRAMHRKAMEGKDAVA